jgi:hypothetical protein
MNVLTKLSTHPPPLAFNSTLPPNQICNWELIWAQIGQIVQNKSLRTKVKIIK